MKLFWFVVVCYGLFWFVVVCCGLWLLALSTAMNNDNKQVQTTINNYEQQQTITNNNKQLQTTIINYLTQ